MPFPFGPIKKKIRKKKKDFRPGVRVPTPPPTKPFKSIKDYKRKKIKKQDIVDYD